MIEPYYADDLVTIYHGDATEILPTLSSASVDAVITDPPYIIGAVSAEECGDEIDPGRRRIRCKSCRVLVCGWCYHHGHGLGYRRAVAREQVRFPNE